MHIILYVFRPFNGFYGCILYILPITYCLMQKHTPGMFLTDFHMQKYTGGIISRVGIFLTLTPAANKSIPRIYDFCTILVLYFMPVITNIMVQHKGDTFTISTDLRLS